MERASLMLTNDEDSGCGSKCTPLTKDALCGCTKFSITEKCTNAMFSSAPKSVWCFHQCVGALSRVVVVGSVAGQ